MTALIIVGSILATIAAYFTVGSWLAITDMPRAWERARAEWSLPQHVRDSVVWQSIFTAAFWPAVIPFRWWMRHLKRLVTERDPREMRRRLSEREARIAELERDLGIR